MASSRSYKKSYRRLKKSFRSTRRRLSGKKYYKKVLKKGQMTLVNSSKPKLNIPINPKFLTKFTVSATGYVPSAAGPSGFFAVKLNSPYQPLNASAGLFTAVTNGSGVYLGAISSGVNPRGFSNLCSLTMYNNYRVYASRIKITVIPRSVLDQVLVTVVPITNATLSAQTAELEQNVAFSKEIIASSNTDNNRNTFTHYIDLQSLDGLNKYQLMSDTTKVGTYQTNPSDLSVWAIKWLNTNNAALNSALAFNYEITYYTELFEMNYESMSVA